MGYYIKKMKAGSLPILAGCDSTNWGMAPAFSAQDWEFVDSTSSGSLTTFKCAEPQNMDDFVRGEFYQIFSSRDVDFERPLCAFELQNFERKYIKDEKFTYECSGKSWRHILGYSSSDFGVLVTMNLANATITQIIAELLKQTAEQHSAFSQSLEFVRDDGYRFSSYRAKKALAGSIIKDLKDQYDYQIFFDSDLKLHLYRSTDEPFIRSIQDVLSPNAIELASTSNIYPGMYVVLGGYTYSRIESVDHGLNQITTERSLYPLEVGSQLLFTNAYVINLDYDKDLFELNVTESFQDNLAASGNIIVYADNIIQQQPRVEILPTVFGDSFLPQATYPLAGSPGKISTKTEDFGSATTDLLADPSIPGGQEISDGRYRINDLAGELLSTQHQGLAESVGLDGGLSAGISVTIEKTTGCMGLLGLQRAPADDPANWIAGFLVEDLRLKVVSNGKIVEIDFPNIVPTVTSNITNIIGAQIVVDDATGFIIGRTISLQQLGGIVEVVIIQDIIGNTIIATQPLLAPFQAGLQAVQLADYLMKWSYQFGHLNFYVKEPLREKYTIVHTQRVSLSGDGFIQLYANSEHKASIDFVSLVENLTIAVYRLDVQGDTAQAYDVGFAEFATKLGADVLVETNEDDDSIWQLTLAASTQSVPAVTEVISPVIFDVENGDGLRVNENVIINGERVSVLSVEVSPNSTPQNELHRITVGAVVSGVVLNTLLYDGDFYLATGESLKADYLSTERVTRNHCAGTAGSSCAASSNKVARYVDLTNDSVDFTEQEFNNLADRVLAKYCEPEISGSFDFHVDALNRNRHRQKMLSEMPHAGQKLLLLAPQHKTPFNGSTATISSVKYETLNNEELVNVSVEYGTTNDYEAYLARITSDGAVNLVNDDLPEESIMCAINETLFISEDFDLSSTGSSYPFVGGVYTVMTNAVVRHEVGGDVIDLSSTGSSYPFVGGVYPVMTSGVA